MWSNFAVTDKALWLEKLQREAGKTLGPDIDALAALTWNSPDGITYAPLYQRLSGYQVAEGPPGGGGGNLGWQPTRILQALTAASQIQEALAHDCLDFSAPAELYQQLQPQFPQARWWLPLSEGLVAPHAWEIDALALPEQKIPTSTTLVLSTREVREQGGSIASELWIGLSAWIELHRRGALRGQDLGWSTAFSTQILAEAAKCSSIRRLWAKFSHAVGLKSSLSLHGAQAAFNTARLDQATNLLRSASAAWVACLAGCQTVRLEPYSDDPQAARLARNQVHLMLAEGSLQKVSDPLSGAFALEEWSEQLARQAWSKMRSVEAAGGLDKVQVGLTLQHELEAQRSRLDRDEQVLVGLTRYVPIISSKTVTTDDTRLAVPFENLRQAFAARFADNTQAAVLLVAGSPAKLGPRIDFARGFLALVGLDPKVVSEPGTAHPIVVLCCADRDHAEWVPRCLQALQPGQVLVVAGKPDLPGDYLKIYKGAARSTVLQAILKAVSK